ncbi:MAG: methyltransferase domain-containing protein [Chlamydiota bacterium]|nr:methyltransferase domain-containing protein [Chlamydiota bacterium]
MQTNSSRIDDIKEYYGKTLQSNKDLKTSACCPTDAVSSVHRDILTKIHPEILDKFYGCGSPLPAALEGCTILDLGCGTGRDVYLASKLSGPKGNVIGIDMYEAQLKLARKHLDFQMKTFDFVTPNVTFKQGYIEDLQSIGIADNSIDVVTSNCVINLSPDKASVFREIFRVLKPGGELIFSDVFAGRRVPEHFQHDPVLLGECLGGALYIEDFRRLLRNLDCLDFRILNQTKIEINNPDIEKKAGMIDFYSMTIRAFKLNDLEDLCEDYGQSAVYLGSIPEDPHHFVLDNHHVFEKGKMKLVCGNTASMLENTRYRKYFKVTGHRNVHYGPFPCAPESRQAENGITGSCC